MKRILYLIFLLLLIGTACRKDKFPDEFSIYGYWHENIPDPVRTEMEFDFKNNLSLRLRNDTIKSAYKYRLDKANELEIFEIIEFPDGKRTTHKVTYNSRNEQMTIFGLYPASGGTESQTVFIRN